MQGRHDDPLLPTSIPSEGRELFDELMPGDRVEVEHLVTVGVRKWTTKTVGTVVRTERRGTAALPPQFRRQGLQRHRSCCELPDGELTTVTLDEFTTLRRA